MQIICDFYYRESFLLGKSLQMGNPMPRFNLTLNMTPAITSKVCQDERFDPISLSRLHAFVRQPFRPHANQQRATSGGTSPSHNRATCLQAGRFSVQPRSLRWTWDQRMAPE